MLTARLELLWACCMSWGDSRASVAQGVCLCPSLLFAKSASLAGVRLFVCSLPKDKKLVELMKIQASCGIKIANHFFSLLFFRVKRPPRPSGYQYPQYQQVQFAAILKISTKQNLHSSASPSVCSLSLSWRLVLCQLDKLGDTQRVNGINGNHL